MKFTKKILSAKKPKSSVPGDLPMRLVKEFAVEMSRPLQIIFNKALKECQYPEDWKMEFGIDIPKISNPQYLDDVRLISLTKFCSKIFEPFIVEWIFKFTGKNMDPYSPSHPSH